MQQRFRSKPQPADATAAFEYLPGDGATVHTCPAWRTGFRPGMLLKQRASV